MSRPHEMVAPAIDRVVNCAEALAYARADEMRLEDERALVKRDAVLRIMQRDGIAATPAEKIVETDEMYMAHRALQRAAVVATQRAWGDYEAARVLATHAADQYRISFGGQ